MAYPYDDPEEALFLSTLEESPLTSTIFENTLKSLDERFSSFPEDVRTAPSLGSLGIRTTGLIGGTIGDIAAAVPDELFEQTGLNDKIESVIRDALDTEKGKQFLEFLREHPEGVKDFQATLDTFGVIPSTKLAKNVVNDVLHNVATKVEGGAPGEALQYIRETAAKVKGVPPPVKPNFYNAPHAQPLLIAGGAVDGLFGSLNDRFNPFGVANRRAGGFTSNRRREIRNALEAGKTLDAAGSASAGRMLNQQRYGTDTPMYAVGSPLHSYQYLETDIPSTDTERIMSRIGGSNIPAEVTQRHFNDFDANILSGRNGLDEKLNSMLNPPSRGTTVDIVNPNAFNAASEFADLPFDVAPGTSLNKMWHMGKFEQMPENATDFELSVAGKAADDTNWRIGNKLGGKTKAGINMLHAVDKRKRGETLTPKEELLVKQFDKTSSKVKPTDEFGFTHSGSSYVSGQKQFGGVHQASSIKGDDIYNTVSDNHNLLGMNLFRPVTNKAAIYPTMKRTLGREGDTTDLRRERFPTRDDFQNTNTESLEKLSGVSRRKGENAVDYQLRAIGEMKAKPELRDYAEVLQNLLWTTYVGTSNMSLDEE